MVCSDQDRKAILHHVLHVVMDESADDEIVRTVEHYGCTEILDFIEIFRIDFDDIDSLPYKHPNGTTQQISTFGACRLRALWNFASRIFYVE